MTAETLDFIFPFVIFGYGVVMTFVLSHPKLMNLASEKFPPELVNAFKGKRILSICCLIIGGLWSLQNLWLS